MVPHDPSRRARAALAPCVVAVGAVIGIGLVFRPGGDVGAASAPAPVAPAGGPVRPAAAAPRLRLYRAAGGRTERLTDGDLARPGDLVQASVVAAGGRHAVVVSVDGRGRVTLHHPRRPGDPTLLPARPETPLAQAFELDDAPGFERFLLVTAPRPLAVEAVVAAARRLARDPATARKAPLPVAADYTQDALLVRKVSP